MIPFPGESVTIVDGVDLTGGGEDYSLYEPLRFRGGSAKTFSITQHWRLWVQRGGMDYLEESGLSCDVAWVIEVDESVGSVTFDAAEMFDATYSDITTAGTPLGTFTTSGPATVVIPSGFTADDVGFGSGGLQLQLTATAGNAEFAQVKLRVWPTGGPLGGWSAPQSSWSTTPTLPGGLQSQLNLTPSETGATQKDSWDATMATITVEWDAGAPGPHTFTSIAHTDGYLAPDYGGGIRAFHSFIDVDEWATLSIMTGAILVVSGADWRTQPAVNPALVDGVDYIRPPDEVRDDVTRFAQQVGDGSTGWVNARAYIGTSSEEAPVYVPTMQMGSTDDLPITSLGGGLLEIDLDMEIGDPVLPMAGSETTRVFSVATPTTDRFIIMWFAHNTPLAPAVWPGPADLYGSAVGVVGFGTGTPGVDFDPMMTFANLPPYRVWTPTAARIIPLRQFHRDDGLGVAPPRAYGGASRLGITRRIYGYD